MDRTLLLNASYEPLLVISWQRAITLLVLEKVEVLVNYEREIRSATASILLPAVVKLVQRVRQRQSAVRFNRTSIYARDRHQCQYCGDQPESEGELTYDHVQPRSRGGKTTWTNIVTCCVPCNRKKGNQTPNEAGMALLKKPVKPSWLPVVGKTLLTRSTPELWRPFLWRDQAA